jgi:hypothetical protein
MALPYPWGHDFCKYDFALCQEAFGYDWSFLAYWFLRRQLSGYPTLYLFCDYLPFEEDLALNLKKIIFLLEFSKGGLIILFLSKKQQLDGDFSTSRDNIAFFD